MATITKPNNFLNTSDPAATSPAKAQFVANQAQKDFQGSSVVDFLNLSGAPSDQASRVALGQSRGIEGIAGADNAAGNLALLNSLRGGPQPEAAVGGALGQAGPGPAPAGSVGSTDRTSGPAVGTAAAGSVAGAPQSPADTAFTKYLDSLNPSKATTDAQSFLDRLTTQSELDNEKALESGETLGFAAGEAGRVARNNAILRGGAARTLAAQSGLDESRQTGAKALLDFQTGRADSAESTRQFDVGTEESTRAFEENQRQFGVQTAQENRDFEENKRQFGLNYAIDQQDLAIRESEAESAAAPEKITNKISQLGNMANQVALARELAEASGASGLEQGIGNFLIGDTEFNQLTSITNSLRTNVLALATDPEIKKFFGPQMSNADVRLMTAAGTTLNPELQSPELILEELNRLDNMFKRIQTSLQQGLAAENATGGQEGRFTTSGGNNVVITETK